MNRDITDTKLVGDAELLPDSSLLDFWRWGFADQCDDDLKGYFAEWMVGTLIGLPMSTSRRVSWADSDLITPSGTRIEVKASAYWQSWKLVNEDGTRKPMPQPVTPDAAQIRFGRLQARTSTGPVAAPTSEPRRFKSDIYVFCMHAQTDPSAWDAWALSHWEFYVMTREELAALTPAILSPWRHFAGFVSRCQLESFRTTCDVCSRSPQHLTPMKGVKCGGRGCKQLV
jgi:hypothetical protein